MSRKDDTFILISKYDSCNSRDTHFLTSMSSLESAR